MSGKRILVVSLSHSGDDTLRRLERPGALRVLVAPIYFLCLRVAGQGPGLTVLTSPVCP